jgi:CMP-N-acetylneuraminic acid synthetase
MSMVEMSYPPFWAMVEAGDGLYRRLFPPEESNRRRHDLQKTYKPDGMIVIISTEEFIKRGNYDFPEIIMYETKGYGSLDIDEPIDLEFAEFLIETGRVKL